METTTQQKENLETKTIFEQLVSSGYNEVRGPCTIQKMLEESKSLAERYHKREIIDFAIIPLIESTSNKQEFRGAYHIFIKNYQ